jgi:hypothetical protein
MDVELENSIEEEEAESQAGPQNAPSGMSRNPKARKSKREPSSIDRSRLGEPSTSLNNATPLEDGDGVPRVSKRKGDPGSQEPSARPSAMRTSASPSKLGAGGVAGAKKGKKGRRPKGESAMAEPSAAKVASTVAGTMGARKPNLGKDAS